MIRRVMHSPHLLHSQHPTILSSNPHVFLILQDLTCLADTLVVRESAELPLCLESLTEEQQSLLLIPHQLTLEQTNTHSLNVTR